MSHIDWKHTVFLLITPDAVARHLVVPILERCHEKGLIPIDCELVQAGPEQLDALYQINITEVWDTYRYRLVDLLFRFGPCLAVLLKTDRPDIYNSLRQIKGSSHPYKSSPGSIRRDLRGINSVLGLLHASDSPEETARESSIFFTDQVTNFPDAENENHSTEEVWHFCRVLALQSPVEKREFDDVLGTLRTKIVAALWREFLPEAKVILHSWERQGIEAFAMPEAGAKLVQLLKQEQRHPLSPILAYEFQPEYPQVNLERTWQILAAYDIEVDKWAQLVLTTSTYFKPCHACDFIA